MLWPAWAIPFVRVLNNLGATLSFHISGRVIEKYNLFRVLITGNLITRIGNFIALIFPTIFSPIIMTIPSFFYGILMVGKDSLLQKEYKDEQRATMSSLNAFAGNVFFGIVSIIIGFIGDLLSPREALIILQFLMLINVYIYYRLNKSH